MKKNSITIIIVIVLNILLPAANAQDCLTSEDLYNVPGKYLTAAQYPWPAVRAEYFKKMATAADIATARKTLEQLEKIEAESHSGFRLTGGNWENYYSTEGYDYPANIRLGTYTFQAALYEYFCAKGKLMRNTEYGTVLRIYTNKIPLNALTSFLQNPFSGYMGSYDLGFQYADWKNRRPADVDAPLITLFNYIACNNRDIMEAINSGSHFFQDVPEKNIRPNTRSTYISRYRFIKKNNEPILVPVTRKEYLQSLLEYYEREKLYFPKLIAKLTADRDNSVKQYGDWEAEVAEKISVVKKVLSENKEEWLSVQAVINPLEDNSQTYRARLRERTNYHRFWKFYEKENRSVALYQYNSAYFKPHAQSPAKPQFFTVVLRYVTMPSSLRIVDNFARNFDFDAVKRLLD